MSFGANTEPPPTKSLGSINADQLQSSQQIIPVTYLAGRRYVAGQFISPCYNQVTVDVKAQTGKSSTGTVAHEYYADFAILFGIGGRQPFDGVFKLIQDADIVWQNDAGLMRDTPDYAAITVTDHGALRLYWGSPTQAIDSLVFSTRGALPMGVDPRDKSTWPANNAAGVNDPLSGHYDRHPAYRNQCYAVFKKWKLGRERTQVPNLMLELERGVPWFAGVSVDRAALGLDSDERGVNPIGVLYDWLTDTITGLGMPDSALRQAGFSAALTYFADFRISVALTAQQDVRAQIIKLLEYIDGFPRQFDDLFDVGFWSHGPIDISTLPRVYDDDLDGEPELKPTSYQDVDTTFFIKYADREHHYNDRPQKFDNPNARRVLGEERRVIEDRSWITDATLAKQYITEFGTIKNYPRQSGSFPMKRERVDALGIREGERFVWDSASRGLEIVLRCEELEWPEDKSGTCTLEVSNEPGIWPALYVPPPDTSLGDFQIEPVAIVEAKIVELPALLKVQEFATQPQIAVLAHRPRLEAKGFNVFLSSDGGSTYDLASANNKFAAYGKVAIAYTAATAILDLSTGITLDLFGADLDTVVAQSDQARDDDTLLLFVDGEIMSVGSVSALGSGRFNLKVRRARFGTSQSTHGVNAQCFFIFRERLIPIVNANFVAGATRLFKLQPFTEAAALDIAGVTAIPFTFARRIPFHISGLEIFGQGPIVEYTGRDVVFDWREVVDYLPPGLDVDPLANPSNYTLIDYKLRVRDAVSGKVVFEDRTAAPPFTFPFERNAVAFYPQSAQRDFIFDVAGFFRDVNNASFLTDYASLAVNNPPPAKLANVDALGVGSSIHIRIRDVITDLDAQPPRFVVHASQVAGFTPSGDVVGQGTCKYIGGDTEIVLQQMPGTWFYRVAAFDSFGPDDLNFSDELFISNNSFAAYIEDLPAPIFDPGQVSFTSSLAIHAMAASGDIIFTRDGSTVQPSSPVWSDPLTIDATTTIRARAISGSHCSPELILFYQRTDGSGGGGSGGGPPCGNVSISIAGGVRGRTAVTVRLNCVPTDATINIITGGTVANGGTALIALDDIEGFYASKTGRSDGPISTFNNEASGPPL